MVTFSNPLALSTTCLGLHPDHPLEEKLQAAAAYGFKGIEIVYGDLDNFSKRQGLSTLAAADQVRQRCEVLKLHVLSLCPFENFEGSPAPLSSRLDKARHWTKVARALGAAHMQVPAQYQADAIGDETIIVNELQQLSDLAAQDDPPIKIAYEPMSWSIYYPTWQEALHLCRQVDRPNFGLCIDTYHIASRIWGDPCAEDGLRKDGSRRLEHSLERFVAEMPIDKLFYLQLSDGERVDPPFSTNHPWYIEGEAAEFSWSKNGRPFPLETKYGAYFPVAQMLKSWLDDFRFNGWVSFETFDKRMRQQSFKPGDGAQRAVESWGALVKAINNMSQPAVVQRL